MTSKTKIRITRSLTISALIVLSGCTGDLAPVTTESAPTTHTPSPTTTMAEGVTGSREGESAAMGEFLDTLSPLPERVGPRRETTGGVPHQQLNAETVPEVDAELRRRVFALPGVEDRASTRSLPGARGLWLAEGFEIQGADAVGSLEVVLGGGREFAHIHPDGSLHVWLPVQRALEVHDTKWGELHPWVDRDGFWDGVVMVYTPESLDELEVTLRIVVDAYNFITGESLAPDDLP